ncbi:ATP-binding protein [Geobacter sp. SVR]|uniref:GAF domain-containing sensor histidine kinase n=1 Tax=Geobacter sp. SVR TaxID=2495594 RepID=UPI00143F03E6|nr:ATP-binding protein [Geobacter sp. SVR]BCS53577.1 hypothetical protein GSVR_18850 [Geobacter sp. SVR]GCF84226.1 hypothetical protein GSbR_08260 [Geobacter sp. SVR]
MGTGKRKQGTDRELDQLVAERTRELEERCAALERRGLRLKESVRELKRSCYRYWSLYNWSPVGYLAVDHELRIAELNMAAARLLGARRSDLVGSSLERLLNSDNRERLQESFSNCMKNKHDEVEVQVTLQENQYLYVQIFCEPYHMHGKPSTLYRMAIIDISKLKEAESKLHRLNRLYALLSATGKAIVHNADRKELFEEICRIAVEQGGFTKACIGWLDNETGIVSSVATAGVRNEELCICFNESLYSPGPIAAAIRDGRHYVSNDCLRDPNTAYRHSTCGQYGIRASAVFALTRAGAPVGAFSLAAGEYGYFDPQMVDLLDQMVADISFALEHMEQEDRRREAEVALQRETLEKLHAVVELRRKEQLLLNQSRQAAMGELLGNIAHHWRQPLNVIALIIQDLDLQFDQGVTREYLAASTRKAMQVILQLSQTINDFRDFFRPDHTRSLFRLNDAVARTMSLVEASFRNFQFSTSVSSEEDIFVNGYQHEFSQVLLNIMLNARDAFAERRVTDPKLEIHLFREGEWCVVTVVDNAGGIPEDILPLIFDPYFTTKGPDRGSGIGLYMAKTIIENNMNGRLTVTNTGQGAEFRIELPA